MIRALGLVSVSIVDPLRRALVPAGSRAWHHRLATGEEVSRPVGEWSQRTTWMYRLHPGGGMTSLSPATGCASLPRDRPRCPLAQRARPGTWREQADKPMASAQGHGAETAIFHAVRRTTTREPRSGRALLASVRRGGGDDAGHEVQGAAGDGLGLKACRGQTGEWTDKADDRLRVAVLTQCDPKSRDVPSAPSPAQIIDQIAIRQLFNPATHASGSQATCRPSASSWPRALARGARTLWTLLEDGRPLVSLPPSLLLAVAGIDRGAAAKLVLRRQLDGPGRVSPGQVGSVRGSALSGTARLRPPRFAA